jgi:hypothetical protein
MDELISAFLKQLPLEVAIAIGAGVGAFYFFRFFRTENQLNSEEEQKIRDTQDADRDAEVTTLRNTLAEKEHALDTLIAINKALRAKIGIFDELDDLHDLPESNNPKESDQKT